MSCYGRTVKIAYPTDRHHHRASRLDLKSDRLLELVKMEFRRFLNTIMLIPCQIVRTARRVIYRVLGYNGWLADFFATWERLHRLVLVE